jgi:hypothetical protein
MVRRRYYFGSIIQDYRIIVNAAEKTMKIRQFRLRWYIWYRGDWWYWLRRYIWYRRDWWYWGG